MSSDLKQELQRLFTQPAPEARPSQHSPSPIGPSSSSSSHQYCEVVTSISPTSRSSPLAYVTSSSPTSRSSLLAYVPSWNDCSWHRTYSWEGVPFPTIHNGYITDRNVDTFCFSGQCRLQVLLFSRLAEIQTWSCPCNSHGYENRQMLWL